MAVIPTGAQRGKVLAWDATGISQGNPVTSWLQRWSILDPEAQGAPSFDNFELSIADDAAKDNHGDLFCSGHAWMADGRLFVAGGNNYGLPPGVVKGNKLAFIYDPAAAGLPFGKWNPITALDQSRYYPTVTLQGDSKNRMIVFGGVNSSPPDVTKDGAMDTYEVWDPTRSGPDRWERIFQTTIRAFPGPRTRTDHPLDIYPRMHFVSELATGIGASATKGRSFMSGFWTKAAHLDHANAPGSWPGPWPQQSPGQGINNKNYVSAVLFPNLDPTYRDQIMTIGGEWGGVLNRVEKIDLKSSMPAWTALPSLCQARNTANAVLLPDGSVLVLGGNGSKWGVPETPVLTPEIFKNGVWTPQPAEASPRTYHSTAVLLPSGRVLTAGGDSRVWDYQVFTPPYLAGSPTRPVWGTNPAPPTTINYGQTFTLSFDALPFGVTIEKVVLMAPCSITHHSDMHQRYEQLELVVEPPPVEGTVQAKAPKNATYAPRGFYMMFMLTSQGVPSVASWVRLL